MLSTDSFEDLIVQVQAALNAAKRIPAQNIHVVCLDELVAESFHLNRRFCITLCPQEMNTLSELRNAGVLSLRSFRRSHDEITKEVQISNGIEHPIDHECRERVGGIYRDVSPLLNSSTDIQAVCLQSWKKIVSV